MNFDELTSFDVHYFLDYTNELDATELLFLFVPPLLGMVLAITLGIILNRKVSSYISNHPSLQQVTWKTALIHGCKGLPLLFVVSVYVYFVVKLIQLPEPVDSLLSYLLFCILSITILLCIARTISRVVNTMIAHNGDVPQTTLLENIIYVVVFSIGIGIILAECGISIAPIITAMGVGGVAVALGMQDGLANFFSGLYLIFSRQIHIGDYIRLSPEQEGQVADITWRYTTISNVAGNSVIVPNKRIADAILTNFSMPAQDIKIKIQCGVAYDSDLEQVERITLEVARKVQSSVTQEILLDQGQIDNGETISVPEPGLFFHTFGDSAIQFSVSLNCKDFSHQYKMKHVFIKELTKRYRDEGIVIPYPILSIMNEAAPQE